MKIKKTYYSICLGIGLNMIVPEFKRFGFEPITAVKSKFHN